jgi:hypothetical protein
MLFRGHARSRVRLLFWSALCFVGLTVENAMLYVDVALMPDISLAVWRKLPALCAMLLLLFGLIWESK